MPDQSQQINEGIKKTQDLFKSTIVTVVQNNISITLSAEPRVLELKVDDLPAIEIQNCFNEAIEKSKRKMAEILLSNLQNK